MSTIVECLKNLSKLANTNTELLKGLNESLISNKSNISVIIDGIKYNIPSFINLENKINTLQENFNNLINSPEKGEAFFTINGNSRAIVVRDYQHAPYSVDLKNVTNFYKENNDIFKDFLTPVPYINFNVDTTNDITSFIVKKIIPKTEKLINYFKSELSDNISIQKNWLDIKQLLSSYTEDIDYTEYDKIIKLPIRTGKGNGIYVIESIIEDIIDDNLDNYITIKIRNDIANNDPELTDLNDIKNNLEYTPIDSNLSVKLTEGDILITYDNSAKMEIVEIINDTTFKIKILNGEYLNLVEYPTGNKPGELSKLRYFNDININNSLKIPLEEDQYIYTTIAAYKESMNVRSDWGIGLLINTYKLINDNNEYFETYYKNNVKNIGDTLYELTNLFTQDYITQLTNEQIIEKVNYKPIIDQNNLTVAHINKHLNDTTTVKTIKSLYNDKKNNEASLTEIQNKILDINNKLATISFDDTTGIRTIYESQLNEYNSKKNELVTSITKNIDAIATTALNSEIPIEEAKYRIRGFYKIETNDIIGIKVQYRYKNAEQIQGNALSIGENFVFSEWNEYTPPLRLKTIEDVNTNANINIKWQEYNDDKNEPSCNQIDIPISQGETVDIRIKLIYNYSYPLAQIESQWSDIINIKFPEEYLKDIQVTTILEENNNDIESNRFKNILNENGVNDHVSDKLTDQDLTYFHKSESIASGFYTSERRIVPLKDKLTELDNNIKELQNLIEEVSGDLSVNIQIGNSKYNLLESQSNEIIVANYSQFINEFPQTGQIVKGNYILKQNGIVYLKMNIVIKNNSDKYTRIYSVFPGSRNIILNDLTNFKFDKNDYINGTKNICYEIPSTDVNNIDSTPTAGGVELKKIQINGETKYVKPQTANQVVTFRINNIYDGEIYYKDGDTFNESNKLSYDNIYLNNIGAAMYILLNSHNGLCLDDDNKYRYLSLVPGDEFIIPIIFEYKLDASNTNISKTMSFDLRNSLYEDLKNYTFRVTANYNPSIQDTLIDSNNEVFTAADIKYNSIVK